MMGVKNPNSFEQRQVLRCIFEEKGKKRRTTTSTHLVGTWKETCHFVLKGHDGGRGNRNTTQIPSMTFDSFFKSTYLEVSSAICTGNTKNLDWDYGETAKI